MQVFTVTVKAYEVNNQGQMTGEEIIIPPTTQLAVGQFDAALRVGAQNAEKVNAEKRFIVVGAVANLGV